MAPHYKLTPDSAEGQMEGLKFVRFIISFKHEWSCRVTVNAMTSWQPPPPLFPENNSV